MKRIFNLKKNVAQKWYLNFRAGFNGEECLLKTICETSAHPFAEHNGILGDIMHIAFT